MRPRVTPFTHKKHFATLNLGDMTIPGKTVPAVSLLASRLFMSPGV